MILFDKLAEIPLLIAAAIVSFFILKNFDSQALVPILLLTLSPLARIVKYVSTYYTIEDGHLIVETGIFNRKRIEIPLREITTVDLSQNILYQFFKTYKIKVDNGSQTSDAVDKAEVQLALKADKAFEFKRIITQNAASGISEDENIGGITASWQDFIKLGLLQSKIMYFFTAAPIAVPVIGAVAALATGSKSSDELLNKMFDQASAGIAVFTIVVFFYCIALGVSLIKPLFTFYNFRISGNADVLKIEYGLLNKKKFSLQKSKINGIRLKQNLLMRVFRCYTSEILVIGYGDKSDDELQEQAIFYPIASMEKIRSMAKELLPGFVPEYNLQKPDRKAKWYFFYRSGLIVAVLFFIVALFTKNIILVASAGGITVIALISAILQYFSAGISCGENKVVFSFGGYHKTIAIIRTADIESITAKGSIFKRKKGIVSIRLGFIGPLRASNITVLNMPAEQYKLLENVIEY